MTTGPPRVRDAGGLHAAARRVTRRALRIIGYHGLWTSPGTPHGETLFMAPEAFAARMRWLAASRYPVLPLAEAVARLADGTLPDCAVVITIDDGWASTATHMAPVLAELGLPATLYVSTWYVEHQAPVTDVLIGYVLERTALPSLDLSGLLPGLPAPLWLGQRPRTPLALRIAAAIDTLPGLADRVAMGRAVAGRAQVPLDGLDDQFRFVTPAELRAVSEAGIAIELHGHRHKSVDAPGADLAREIADNRAALLRAGIARPATHFCYPRGDLAPGIDTELAAAGVLSATTTRRGINPPGTSPYRLARLLDGPRVSQARFEAWLAGLYHPLDRLRG